MTTPAASMLAIATEAHHRPLAGLLADWRAGNGGARAPRLGPVYLPEVCDLLGMSTEETALAVLAAEMYTWGVSLYTLVQILDATSPRESVFAKLVMPHPDSLSAHEYELAQHVRAARLAGRKDEHAELMRRFHLDKNAQPANQAANVPQLEDGTRVDGVQHKYPSIALVHMAPVAANCGSYCFPWCFRRDQFHPELGMAIRMSEPSVFIRYLGEHPEITTVLFTGGDSLFAEPAVVADRFIRPIAAVPQIDTIRFGTKLLTYDPAQVRKYLALMRELLDNAVSTVAVMAHLNHPGELEPPLTREVISELQGTGVQIYAQGPILRDLNDEAATIAGLMQTVQVLGIHPHYLFHARNQGPDYAILPVMQTLQLVSRARCLAGAGIRRSFTGPTFSIENGKVVAMGIRRSGGIPRIVFGVHEARDERLCGLLFETFPAAGYDWTTASAVHHLAGPSRWDQEMIDYVTGRRSTLAT